MAEQKKTRAPESSAFDKFVRRVAAVPKAKIYAADLETTHARDVWDAENDGIDRESGLPLNPKGQASRHTRKAG